MPRPLRNRFVHLDLEPDLDDWCRWAVKAQVRPEIIAFLRFKPELLHTTDATSDANACQPVLISATTEEMLESGSAMVYARGRWPFQKEMAP